MFENSDSILILCSDEKKDYIYKEGEGLKYKIHTIISNQDEIYSNGIGSEKDDSSNAPYIDLDSYDISGGYGSKHSIGGGIFPASIIKCENEIPCASVNSINKRNKKIIESNLSSSKELKVIRFILNEMTEETKEIEGVKKNILLLENEQKKYEYTDSIRLIDIKIELDNYYKILENLKEDFEESIKFIKNQD